MNFVPSITDPPPTANRKSTPSTRANSIARTSVAYSGLGSIPPNSTTERPRSAAITWSYTPFRRILPPPYVIIMRASAGISSAKRAMVPFPKINRVGLQNVKLFISKIVFGF